MATVSELKKALFGENVNNEIPWLQTFGATAKTPNAAWNQVLVSAGYTTGTLSDKYKAWLQSQTGLDLTVSVMEKYALENDLYSFTVAPILQYLSAGGDDSDIGSISPAIGTGTLTQGILSQQPSRTSNIISHIQSNNQYWVSGHLAQLDFGTDDFSTFIKFRTSTATSITGTLYSCGILGGGRNGFGFYVRGTTHELVFQSRTESGDLLQIETNDAVNDGNWKIAYVERVSGVWNLYLANSLEDTDTVGIDLDGSTSDPFIVGGRYNGSSYTGASYDGDWTHIEIYDQALSVGQRTARYNQLLAS